MSAEIIAFRKREKPKDKSAAPPPSKRSEAIDAFRGLCVIGLILATGFVPAQSRAHGLDLNHLLSAGFLLCIGMAIPLSLAGRAARQSRARLMVHIVLRTAILVALGVIISNVPGADFTTLAVAGPLQYAGLGYGLVAMFCLSFGRKSDADFTLRVLPVTVAALGVLGLCAGLQLVGWPGRDMAAAFGVDVALILRVPGILAIVLLGVVASLLLRRQTMRNIVAGLAFIGILLFVAGGGLAGILQADGDLWTPSFALIAGGTALIAFALLAIATEIPGIKLGAYPLRVLGGNALLAFIAATVVARLVPMTPLYAAALVPVIGLPLWGLHLRRIHLVP